jgi:hypothetical protein
LPGKAAFKHIFSGGQIFCRAAQDLARSLKSLNRPPRVLKSYVLLPAFLAACGLAPRLPS